VIPYGRQWLDEDDIRAVNEVLRSSFLTQGTKVQEFENALCQISGAKHAIAVSNGTVALYLACRVIGVGKDDIGITSAISFSASANCIVLNGATPEFIDISENDLNIDCLSLEKRLENKDLPAPKIVIPVDFAGIPANLPYIYELSKKHGFKVIEDAAHSIGSTYYFHDKWHNCGSCSHTDLAIFSFHPVKTITTGEGGAVLTNDDALANKLRVLSNHGIERDKDNFIRKDFGNWYYELQDVCFNFRITDMQCALGISQLKKLNTFKKKRQKIYKKYLKAFAGYEKKGLLKMTRYDENITDPCPHLFVIRLAEKSPVSRDELYKKLLKYDISAQVHYFPIHLQPYYMEKHGFKEGMFPVAEHYAKNCLSLPLYPLMNDEDVQAVIKAVSEIMEG